MNKDENYYNYCWYYYQDDFSSEEREIINNCILSYDWKTFKKYVKESKAMFPKYIVMVGINADGKREPDVIPFNKNNFMLINDVECECEADMDFWL